MLVYAVYADKKTFHVTLLASGKAEGAKVPDPSAPLEIPAKLTMTATKGITPFLLSVVLSGKFVYILDSLVQRAHLTGKNIETQGKYDDDRHEINKIPFT